MVIILVLTALGAKVAIYHGSLNINKIQPKNIADVKFKTS